MPLHSSTSLCLTPTPPTPPEPPPPASNGGSNSGDYNQGQLETIRKSETLARCAQQEAYQAALLEHAMEQDTPAKLLTKCAEWREISGLAVNATTAKEKQTDEGGEEAEKLRQHVEFLRGRARHFILKNKAWAESAVTAFKARYFINKDILSSRPVAEQSVTDMLDHAREDKLPGVTDARLTEIAKALAAYINVGQTQPQAQSKATKTRTERDKAFSEALDLRHDIQFAADTAWPWYEDANVAVRREFLLPAGRPFTG